MAARKLIYAATAVTIAAVPAANSWAQVPDLLNALDAGGRAMGYGGGSNTAGSSTLSSFFNPAGLANVGEGEASITLRNLPESRTTVSGNFRNLRQSTTTEHGGNFITHAGFAKKLNNGGGIGIAYTTGGFIRDLQVGDNLPDGALTIRQYSNLNYAKLDFVTLGYGKSFGDHGLSLGLGIAHATAVVRNQTTGFQVDGGGNIVGNLNVDNRSTGTGFGFIVGLQYVPPSNPNMSFGLSYRSAIDLNDNASTAAYLDRVPARLSGGVAFRRDGVRGGRDFLVYGLQADAFIGGQRNKLISRKDVVALGGGFEYNYHISNFRIPIRLGYQLVPAGGDSFGTRHAVTFGIGVRPMDSNFMLDLNFASPNRGGQLDMAFTATIRLGK